MLLISKNKPPILYVETITDSYRHVNKLLEAWNDIIHLSEDYPEEVRIDFHYCEFLGHIGVAFLGGIVRLIESRSGHVTFDWNSLPREIRMNLAQNGFLHDFGYDCQPWDGNSVPYRSDRQQDPKVIADYLKNKWLGKGWVNISPGLQNAITGKVLEIYLNAFEHSQSNIGVYSCGQHYPKACTLQLTVVDFGIGIPESVRTLPENSTKTAAQALEWAFIEGNSTKNQNGIDRGAGLHLLQQFIRKNHGNLMIFSNDGYVNISDNGTIYKNVCTNFSGTLVNIAFRCDEKYYCLASEVAQLKRRIF